MLVFSLQTMGEVCSWLGVMQDVDSGTKADAVFLYNEETNEGNLYVSHEIKCSTKPFVVEKRQ